MPKFWPKWNVLIENIQLITNVAPWCSGYHYCTTSFNSAWTQVLRRFKPCLGRAGDSQWWGSLAMVPAGNKAKCFSSVNHTTKTIYHHHHTGEWHLTYSDLIQIQLPDENICWTKVFSTKLGLLRLVWMKENMFCAFYFLFFRNFTRL